MPVNHLLIMLLILFNLIQTKEAPKNYIERTRMNYEPAFVEVSPKEAVREWRIPFITGNRQKFNTIKVISVFGDARQTYLKGHIHTGADIIPAKGAGYIYVYPMANGVVCSIHLGHPHKTVVVKHRLPDSTFIFTSYKHLQEVYVKTGTQVNPDTKIARLYTRAEAKKLGGNYDHLHLEIRKLFYDYGCASWLTMTKEELNKYFYNPADFMRKKLGK